MGVTLCILSDRPAHLRVLLACLHLQTYPEWQAVVLDQSLKPGVDVAVCDAANNTCYPWRLSHVYVPNRGDWGQAEKFKAAQAADTEWVGFPNDDAYYCPRYLELMLQRADDVNADLVYCDWVSATDPFGMPYVPYAAAPRVGQIDVGGFLVKRKALMAHGWPNTGPTGDGVLIESLIRRGVPHVRVPATLYIKN